jgi:hypothetical protein
MHTTERSKLGVLNKLAQLQRDKERITQEKQNWQNKIALIDGRLEELATLEKNLYAALAADESTDEARAETQKTARQGSVHQERSHAEAVHTMTMHY